MIDGMRTTILMGCMACATLCAQNNLTNAAALEKMDDQKAGSSPEMSAAFLHVIVHNNEIYGNVVGYLRVSGIVPPSTAAMRSQSKTK